MRGLICERCLRTFDPLPWIMGSLDGVRRAERFPGFVFMPRAGTCESEDHYA